MRKKEYEIRYLPLFFEELDHDISYIAFELKNKIAANRLLDEVEASVLKRLEDGPENRFFVKEGDTLADYGFPDIKVVELPGHSKGSIGLLVSDDAMLVGDALDNWIRPATAHLYTDLEAEKKTVEKIRSFGKRTYYYGHGKPTDKF